MSNNAVSMALDFDGWMSGLPGSQRDAVEKQLNAAADRQAEKQKLTNIFWLSEKTGLPLNQVNANYDAVRSAYGTRAGWGDAYHDDKVFSARVTSEAASERDEDVMIRGIDGNTAEAAAMREKSMRAAAYNAGSAFHAEDPVTAYSKWSRAAGPAFRVGNAGAYWSDWMVHYTQGRQDAEAAKAAAEGAFPILSQADSGGVDKAVQFFRDLTPAQKALAMKGISELSGKNPGSAEGKGTGSQAVLAFGRMLSSISSGVDRSFARDRLMSLKFEAGQQVPEGDNAAVISHFVTEGDPVKPLVGSGNLTAERAAALNEAVQGKLKDLALAQELSKIADGVVNPLNRQTWGQKMAIGTAESLAAMGVIATPVGFAAMTSSYRADATDDLVEKGVPLEKANTLGWVIGPVQAALDRFQLGFLKKAPGFGNLFQKWSTNAVGNFVMRGTATAGAETLIELTQDQLVPALVQDIAAAWDSQVPDVKWSEVGREAWAQTPDTLLAVLPLALIGAGVATRRDVKNVREVVGNPLALEAAGFKPEQIKTILATKTDREAAQMVRSLWNQRDVQTVATPAAAPVEQPPSAIPAQEAPISDMSVSLGDGDMEGARIRRGDDGWYLLTKQGERIPAGSYEAAASMLEQTGAAVSEEEAQAMVQIADSLAQRDTGKAMTEFTGRVNTVIADMPGNVATLNEQMRALGMTEAVMEGANWIAEDGTRMYQINQGTAPVLTQVHEFAEARFRDLWNQGVADGAVFAARAVAPMFDPAKAKTEEDRAFAERVQAIAKIGTPGAAMPDEATIRETIVELAVANEVGRRKDGSRMPAGALTRGIRAAGWAIANDMQGPRSKILRFIKAIRAYLRGIFGVAAKLQKARRDGVDLRQFDSFVNQLVGIDEQKRHEAEVARAAGFSLRKTDEGNDISIKEWVNSIPVDKTDRMPNRTDEPFDSSGFAPGSLVRDGYGDDPYVYEARWVNPSDFDPRVDENSSNLEGLTYEQVVSLPTTQQYIEWYKSGHFGPPITLVYNGPAGRLKSTNRRRVISAIEAGIPKIPAFVEIGKASEVYASEFGKNRDTTFSVTTADTLDAIAARMNAGKRPPKERLRIYTAIAEDARGMARAIRFNEAGIADGLTRAEIDRQRRDKETELRTAYVDEIYARHGEMLNQPDMADLWADPVVDFVFRAKAPGQPFRRSRILSKTAAKRQGMLTGGSYDGIDGVPRWFFSSDGLTPDKILKELKETGSLGIPEDANEDWLWNHIRRTLQSSEKYRKLTRKVEGEIIDAKARARIEARQWADEQIAAIPKRKATDEKLAVRRALVFLDSMLMKLPAEIRSKIGGFVKLATLTTDKAREKFLLDRADKIDRVLEDHLRKEYTAEIEKIFERSQPKGGSGEKAEGKIGATGHAWFDIAREVAKMTRAEGDAKIAAIEKQLAAKELSPDDIAAVARRWGQDVSKADEETARAFLDEELTIVETFAGLEDADAASLASAYEVASEAYENNRQEWIHTILERRERRAALREQAVADAGGPYDAAKHNKVRPAAAVVGLLDMHLSFEQIAGMNFGRESSTHQWARDAARKAQDTETDVMDERRKEFADFMSANMGGPVQSRVKLMELQERVDTGFNGPHAHLSQLQAVHITMLARDESSREWLESHGWSPDVMKELEGWLSPEAKAVRSFLIAQYNRQYDRINAVHIRLKGVSLPRVENYAPRLVEHGGKQQEMAIGQDNAAGMMTGFLRRRFERPQGPPKLADALVAYWGNQTVVTHWLAWAETMGDFRGTIGSRDARLAVETHQGQAISRKLSRELNAIEEGGVREAIAASEVGGLLRRWFDARSKTALFGKLSVLVKQLPAMFGSAAKVRAGKWMSSARRVMTGRGAISLAEMYASPVIQRRLANESEIAALAGKGEKNTPGLAVVPKAAAVVDLIMGKTGGAIGHVDAAFTTFSAAVAYDASFRELKEAGLSDEEAKAMAWDRTAVVVGQTAQPQTLIDKSLLEVEWPTMGRLIFAFQGANRQAWSLMYEAVRNFRKDPVAAAQALGLFVAVIPTLTYFLGGLVRYATSDDDLEDEFSVKGWAHQIAAAPLSGTIIVGPVWESIWQASPRQAESPIGSDFAAAMSAFRKLIESDEERAKRPKDQREFDAKDLGKILDGLATAIGGRASAIGVANNVLQQVLGVAAAVKEGDQGRESFQAKKNRADAKKAAKGQN